MTKRKGDPIPDPPGGRAAERLRMFLDARRPKPDPKKPNKSRKGTKRTGPENQEES
jgi:hypothetical protein